MKLFAELLQEYFEAAATGGAIERHFLIGDAPVDIRFSSDSVAREMTSALAHLERTPGIEDSRPLTIAMWDASSPAPNHLLRAYLFTLGNWWYSYTGKRGELLDVQSDNLIASYHPGTAILSVVDLEHARAFYWKSDTAPIPYYESCSPFRSVLHVWLRHRGSFFLHGAGIGDDRGGILLVGKGGSGKSTTALACLHANLRVAGDDYCIVRRSAAGDYLLHSLYCTAKLVEMSNLAAFPELAAPVLNPVRQPGEKVAMSLSGYRNRGLIERFPLCAVLVPTITHERETRIQPTTAQDTLIALAPSTLSQLPASGASDLRFLSAVTRELPCFRILLGSDLARIPQAIEQLIVTLAKSTTLEENTRGVPA